MEIGKNPIETLLIEPLERLKILNKAREQQEIKIVPIIKYGVMLVEKRNDVLCIVDKNGHRHACNDWNSLNCGRDTV